MQVRPSLITEAVNKGTKKFNELVDPAGNREVQTRILDIIHQLEKLPEWKANFSVTNLLNPDFLIGAYKDSKKLGKNIEKVKVLLDQLKNVYQEFQPTETLKDILNILNVLKIYYEQLNEFKNVSLDKHKKIKKEAFLGGYSKWSFWNLLYRYKSTMDLVGSAAELDDSFENQRHLIRANLKKVMLGMNQIFQKIIVHSDKLEIILGLKEGGLIELLKINQPEIYTHILNAANVNAELDHKEKFPFTNQILQSRLAQLNEYKDTHQALTNMQELVSLLNEAKHLDMAAIPNFNLQRIHEKLKDIQHPDQALYLIELQRRQSQPVNSTIRNTFYNFQFYLLSSLEKIRLTSKNKLIEELNKNIKKLQAKLDITDINLLNKKISDAQDKLELETQQAMILNRKRQNLIAPLMERINALKEAAKKSFFSRNTKLKKIEALENLIIDIKQAKDPYQFLKGNNKKDEKNFLEFLQGGDINRYLSNKTLMSGETGKLIRKLVKQEYSYNSSLQSNIQDTKELPPQRRRSSFSIQQSQKSSSKTEKRILATIEEFKSLLDAKAGDKTKGKVAQIINQLSKLPERKANFSALSFLDIGFLRDIYNLPGNVNSAQVLIEHLEDVIQEFRPLNTLHELFNNGLEKIHDKNFSYEPFKKVLGAYVEYKNFNQESRLGAYHKEYLPEISNLHVLTNPLLSFVNAANKMNIFSLIPSEFNFKSWSSNSPLAKLALSVLKADAYLDQKETLIKEKTKDFMKEVNLQLQKFVIHLDKIEIILGMKQGSLLELMKINQPEEYIDLLNKVKANADLNFDERFPFTKQILQSREQQLKKLNEISDYTEKLKNLIFLLEKNKYLPLKAITNEQLYNIISTLEEINHVEKVHDEKSNKEVGIYEVELKKYTEELTRRMKKQENNVNKMGDKDNNTSGIGTIFYQTISYGFSASEKVNLVKKDPFITKLEKKVNHLKLKYESVDINFLKIKIDEAKKKYAEEMAQEAKRKWLRDDLLKPLLARRNELSGEIKGYTVQFNKSAQELKSGEISAQVVIRNGFPVVLCTIIPYSGSPIGVTIDHNVLAKVPNVVVKNKAGQFKYHPEKLSVIILKEMQERKYIPKNIGDFFGTKIKKITALDNLIVDIKQAQDPHLFFKNGGVASYFSNQTLMSGKTAKTLKELMPIRANYIKASTFVAPEMLKPGQALDKENFVMQMKEEILHKLLQRKMEIQSNLFKNKIGLFFESNGVEKIKALDLLIMRLEQQNSADEFFTFFASKRHEIPILLNKTTGKVMKEIEVYVKAKHKYYNKNFENHTFLATDRRLPNPTLI